MGSPLWPAQLDHIIRETDQPETLVEFYQKALDLHCRQLSTDQWALAGPARRLLIKRGGAYRQPAHGFRLGDTGQLAAVRAQCESQGLECVATNNPFLHDAFAVTDPDGRDVIFGLPQLDQRNAGDSVLPGRLQHVVVATQDLPALVAFYRDRLGFVVSDNVYDGDPRDARVTATFMRSDPEHHSLAAFLAPENRPDHLCLETNEWNDIRDWADHMASFHIKLWWGPGRHGPGNNLFFMIEDPEGYKLELSAELEHMPQEMPAREWVHEERTLNLWGSAWMRS